MSAAFRRLNMSLDSTDNEEEANERHLNQQELENDASSHQSFTHSFERTDAYAMMNLTLTLTLGMR